MTAAYHKCMNCGRDFADHNYVAGSVDDYRCPIKTQQSVYGYFHGGDPRTFHPDGDDCTPEEYENHRKACELADRLEREGKAVDLNNPSGWIHNEDGSPLAHILMAPFGIGVQTWEEETNFEPIDASDSELESWQ